MFGGQSFVLTVRGDSMCVAVCWFNSFLCSPLSRSLSLSLSLSLNEVIYDEVVKDIKIRIKIHNPIYQARKYHSSNNYMVRVIVIRSWNVV
ncbi:hypothetical protein AMTRI_Chr12g237210 [Amborella trichopoda]